MDRMDDLEAFVAIVDSGNQTGAARYLGRSLQAVSRSLAALEQSVGVELVRRTTRRSQPTEAGLALYHRVKPALVEIAEAKVDAASARIEPSGLLRVSAPLAFATAFVAPAACDFMERHPQVAVELIVSDQPADLVAAGLDIAVRIRELADSSLRARHLGAVRVVVFGATPYLAAHGRPARPEDLDRHPCIVRGAGGAEETWPFVVGGRRRAVRVRGRFTVDNVASAVVAARRGLGLARAPLWQIRELVDDGILEAVLETYEAAPLPIYAVLPPSRFPAAKTRLFVDMLAAGLSRSLPTQQL
ncbi:LysR family transcriptional regulator [Chelatococcus reniformis]|uniref:LysR family transcriptional regulator n=1 Tax=Chelatococcus reniformis TaxID=1494448 RepID=A0A916XJ13_9HYPH|nr:LysR family transcriptional regulator [Chelatococcus reniformis]GGC75157.1 LysR family transcriptional regulator [Chelatococcus reniformis]